MAKENLKIERDHHYTMVENPTGWDAIGKLFKVSSGSGELFLAMLKLMDDRNALVASQQALGEYIGKSRQAINRYLKLLNEKKYIETYKSGRGYIYTINASIAWRGSRSDRLQAEFECKVLLSLSEQTEEVQRKAWVDRKKQKGVMD